VTTTSSPVRIVSIARRCRAVMGGLSDRAHAAGDAEARALGWTTTRTPGLLGLAGRTYRDPRFDTLQRPA
jgi:hypothetical protein